MADAAGNVLVVDDDPDIRETLGLVLGRHGYAVTTAADGVEALQRIRTGSPRPCVILLDLMMPRMNGFEVWEAMEDTERSTIPVVVLTGASAMAASQAQQLRLEVLRKPIGLGDLLRTVRRFCRD
jgi:CheY-like chemotaxis protein